MANKLFIELIRKALTVEDIIKVLDDNNYPTKDLKKTAQIEYEKNQKLEALENLRIESDNLNNQIHYLGNQNIDNIMLLEILRTLINEINRLSFEINKEG